MLLSSIIAVAPLAGAWIEIFEYIASRPFSFVAPLAGAWIEIAMDEVDTIADGVAPLAGAWIEMENTYMTLPPNTCRSPRGSVD